MTPVDETVAAMVAQLDEGLVELWAERAAVRQHDGGLSRDLAEALALLDVIRMHPKETLAVFIRSDAT